MTKKKKLLISLAALFAAFFVCFLPQPANAQTVTWTQSNANGFGDVNNHRAWAMTTYNNNLYAGTLNATTGAEVWKFDGTAWTQANTDGFGVAGNRSVDSMAVFNNKLYAGVYVVPTGAEVWQYDGTTWTQVNTDGFGDARNYAIYALKEFNSKLYASTYNVITGTEVWQYDGTTWTQVNTDGFGNANNNFSDAMAVYDNKLLVGTGGNLTAGQIWQYNGTTWTQLGTDGFGDTNNHEIFSFLADGSTLYAGTWNTTTGTEVWKYTGTAWSQINTDGFGDVNNATGLSMIKFHHIIHIGVKNETTGGEVWQYDGTAWTQANTDGFGDVNNTRAYTLTEFNHKLYTGTANTVTGAEVWTGQIADTTAPTVTALSPANGATAVAKTSNLSFFLDDDIWGVQSTSIDVAISGQNAITDGVILNGYTGTIVSDGDRGYTVTINPDTDMLYGRKINVSLTFADEFGNQTTSSWSFTIGTPASLGIVMTPASAGGANVRVVNAAGTQISSFFAFDQALRMGLVVAQADVDGDGTNEIVVAPNAGTISYLKAFELDGTLIASIYSFDAGFKGGVSLVTGDFNGDNKEDIAITPKSLGGPQVKIYSLNLAGNGFALLDSFFPYDKSFRGGVNLSAGDLNGDGIDRLVTAPISGHSPLVKTYSFEPIQRKMLLVNEFQAYQTTYLGGVQLATGDINGDDKDDIIVSPYLNGGPNIRAYNYDGASLISWVMAYPNTYRGTLSMQVADLDGDGYGEIVLAPKTLGDSNVKIFRYTAGALAETASFYAYDRNFMGGVNLFVNDVDNDTYAEVMTSPASRGGPNVRVYDVNTGTAVLKGWFWAFASAFRGGVNLGK